MDLVGLILALVFGGSCLVHGVSPAKLLTDALVAARAGWLWARREAMPALRSVAGRYEECVLEVRRDG